MEEPGKSLDAISLATALEQYAFEYRQNINAPYFLRARRVVMDYFLSLLPDHSRVLDINCGTGIDTVEIARRGHRVKGIDVSSTMISFARENILTAGLSTAAEVSVGDYRWLPVPELPFDAVLSDFGGINFTNDLDSVFSSVGGTLGAGGIFLINGVSHFSLMEFLAFATKGKFRTAFRRLSGGTAKIGGREVVLYYHSRNAFVQIGRRHGFRLVDSFGLNILAPPLWADHFFVSHPKIAAFLEEIDNSVRRLTMFRSIGDFVVLLFEKVTN